MSKRDKRHLMTITTSPRVYVCSRTRYAREWINLRNSGWNITSTWIDEAGPGQTKDFKSLWHRIQSEIAQSDVLIAYFNESDPTGQGMFVEIGMALAFNIPVILVRESLRYRDLQGIISTPGSWTNHSGVVTQTDSFQSALEVARTLSERKAQCPVQFLD